MIYILLVLQWFGGGGYEGLEARRQPVCINYKCNSMCAWSAWSNPNMTYSDKAKFYFHTPKDPAGYRLKGAEDWWLAQVPKWVKLEMTISAKELKKIEPSKYVERCKS